MSGAVLCAAVLGVPAAVATAPRSTWDRVFTREQALAGEATYDEYCSACHMPNLEGGEDAPSLVGAPFSAVWEGRSLGDLVARMQARMPQDAPGSLSRDAYVEIAAFLLQKNGFPDGIAPLPNRPDALAEIRYFSHARP